MKGIILAGGRGSRLPTTLSVSNNFAGVRQADDLLSAVDAPPAGIRNILVISTRRICRSCRLLQDVVVRAQIAFAEQSACGLAAPLVGRHFVNGESVCLILGDNIFMVMAWASWPTPADAAGHDSPIRRTLSAMAWFRRLRQCPDARGKAHAAKVELRGPRHLLLTTGTEFARLKPSPWRTRDHGSESRLSERR